MTGSIRPTITEDHMTISSTSHRPSAAEGLHTYGLAGIDLQRATERRTTATSARTTDRQSSLLHRMRQAAGDAIIRLGASIAGEAARPTTAPSIQPKVDLA
ncbi:MAG TPA: hypothetical protein VGR22_00485 [Thermomicrobiales bacterium]|nr:hypothetical protein [Thermomicrobiales bacterium]